MVNLHLYLLISLACTQNFTAEDSLSEEALPGFLLQFVPTANDHYNQTPESAQHNFSAEDSPSEIRNSFGLYQQLILTLVLIISLFLYTVCWSRVEGLISLFVHGHYTLLVNLHTDHFSAHNIVGNNNISIQTSRQPPLSNHKVLTTQPEFSVICEYLKSYKDYACRSPGGHLCSLQKLQKISSTGLGGDYPMLTK